MLKSSVKSTVTLIACLGFMFQNQAQEAKVTVDQPEDVATLLEFKKDIKTVDRYKIQVYKGKRSSAEREKIAVENLFTQWPVDMVFETPDYKIRVGNFESRLEADKALLAIKKEYKDAFIFSPKKNK